jgi:type II secretory ATPase GspE/PulE/Tfp pilus assembly ATPase PilB-like protein
MRQDIDAIMVGEVRDVETATAATYAASTGHMVLTTLHANSAQEIFTRLGLLGANVELFAANVSFASAQRLVEINCTHCAQDETKEQSLWAQTFFKDSNLIPKSGRGCANCNGTGIAGRKLIIEWLSRSPQGELTQKGVLKDDVFKLVKAGMVSSKKAGEVV